MKVFVQLAYGFGANSWRKRWIDGGILGLNEPKAYGYYRAESNEVSVLYSEDYPEKKYQKFLRYGIRVVFGFDFVHTWRNREGIFASDVVWTHTESQTLAVLCLLLFRNHNLRPKLIGQVVWLYDRWNQYWFLKRWFYRLLLKRLDLMTTLSISNRDGCRSLFRWLRVERVHFGIRSDEMLPARVTCRGTKIRVLSLGNDEHRDWETLGDVARQLPNIEFHIASSSRTAKDATQGVSNVRLVRAKNNTELLDLYADADIVVVALHPNFHASGITVIEEAVILGVPVIASDCGGLSDYFAKDALCYVQPGDSAAIINAITSITMDPEAAESRTKAAQTRVRTKINSELYAQMHVELSKKILDGDVNLSVHC
ncbi:glycosyltransferase [Acetobacter sacchari]|uniref:Glycosyltransferase n=2 Tax=Acetobacter sacchari TaxID=2661687 RepID=A0ABS3LUE6_9PROT|nr:glycosyltransferase [Acetobacter sacchari]